MHVITGFVIRRAPLEEQENCLCALSIVLSVLLRCTTSDYSLDNLTLFLHNFKVIL
jgi:hypothetical protein